jgi:ankyrin repeat protein
MPEDAVKSLVEAVQAEDVDRARVTLEQHPDLKRHLDEPMPGLPFDSAPLHSAVWRGNRAMIGLLLDAGADINARTRWWAGGFGVLDAADLSLVPYLLERGAVVDVHAAARLGLIDRLRDMIAAQPSLVHARGGDGQTPLHFASTIEVAAYLLEQGADIDARDIDHESTPAQYMIRDRQDVARYLVSRGCKTDLLMTAALGDVERTRAHLDADPHSVLMSVSEWYFPKENPRSGGTIYIWTLGGHKTAHAIAREFGHRDVFDLLIERSPTDVQLMVACELSDQDRIDRLVTDQPTLVQSLSDDVRRTLATAAERNNTEAVRRMLAIDWPTDPRGEHGATALHWAAFHGNAEMTRDLLQHRASIDARDATYDGTPLDWALHGSAHGWHRETGDYAGTVEALLAAGARPPARPDLEVSDAVRDVLRRSARRV